MMKYLILVIFFLSACGKSSLKGPEDADQRTKVESVLETPQIQAEGDAVAEKSSSRISKVANQAQAIAPLLESSGSEQLTLRREEQIITLEYAGEPQHINLIQARDIEEKREVFTQGVRGQGNDLYIQAEVSNKVDILLVVDNSGSMAEEQVNLAQKLEPLLTHIRDSDWRIGITTTDLRGMDRVSGTADDCMQKIIEKNTPNAEDVFRSTIMSLGISGSGDERGLEATINGLKGECPNGSNFVRQNSHIAVIILSDENNCSNGTACAQAPQDLIDYLNILRPDSSNSKARVYAIVGEANPTPAGCHYSHGSLYLQVANSSKFAGFSGDICSSDYTPVLEKISLHINSLLEKKFILTKSPMAVGDIRVLVNNTVVNSSEYVFNPEGNYILFYQEPLSGSEIKIVYPYLTPEIFSNITLLESPTSSTLDINMNGVKINETEYTFDPENKKITFTTPPPDSAVIEVKYKIGGSLPQSFALSDHPDIYSASLAVSVNGNLLKADEFIWKKDSKSLLLVSAPEEGAEIGITYQAMPTGLKLNYKVDSTKFRPLDRLKFIDRETNEELEILDFAFPEFKIPLDSFAHGKEIKVLNY